MKRTKPPSKLAANASKLHKRILELLTSDNSPYRFYDIRQEYPVKKVNPEFKSGREKFDIVIFGLNVVIEVHGEQHFGIVCFGGKSEEEAKEDLIKRKRVDRKKQQAAEDAYWAYVMIRYDEKNITLEELNNKIVAACDETALRYIAKEMVLK
jgi:hypothetical protein